MSYFHSTVLLHICSNSMLISRVLETLHDKQCKNKSPMTAVTVILFLEKCAQEQFVLIMVCILVSFCFSVSFPKEMRLVGMHYVFNQFPFSLSLNIPNRFLICWLISVAHQGDAHRLAPALRKRLQWKPNFGCGHRQV